MLFKTKKEEFSKKYLQIDHQCPINIGLRFQAQERFARKRSACQYKEPNRIWTLLFVSLENRLLSRQTSIAEIEH